MTNNVPSKVTRAVLFLGGSLLFNRVSKKQLRFIQEHLDQFFILAADHGADLAVQADIWPQLVIGDNDSILPTTRLQLQHQNTPFSLFAAEKDQTDSELALSYLHAHHFQEIYCFGLEGNRLDHFLANILLFTSYIQQGMTIHAWGEHSLYHFFQHSLALTGKIGDTCSLLSLTPNTTGITSTGLAYPLKNTSLRFGTSLGVSNVFERKAVTIKAKKGVLLALHTPI